MNVYNISVVEKAAIELYSNLYPLQENGIQHDFITVAGRRHTRLLLNIFNRHLLSAYEVPGMCEAPGTQRGSAET